MKQQSLDHYMLLCFQTDIIDLFQIAKKFSKADDEQFEYLDDSDYADKDKDIII